MQKNDTEMMHGDADEDEDEEVFEDEDRGDDENDIDEDSGDGDEDDDANRRRLQQVIERINMTLMKIRMMKMMMLMVMMKKIMLTEEDWRCPSSLSCPPCQSSRRPPPLLLALDAIDHDGWSDGDDDGINGDVSEAHLAP